MSELVDSKTKNEKINAFREKLNAHLQQHPNDNVKSSADFSDKDVERFLIAREFNLDKAFDMFLKYVEWYFKTRPDQVSVNDVINEFNTRKAFVHKHDKQNRPVIYVFPDHHYAHETSPAQSVKFMIYTFYEAIRSMKADHHAFTVVIDFSKYGYANMDMASSQQCVSVLEAFFPERLEKVYCINVGFVFWAFWKLIGPFVPARTKSKISFLRANEYLPVLTEAIDKDCLLKECGGNDTHVFEAPEPVHKVDAALARPPPELADFKEDASQQP